MIALHWFYDRIQPKPVSINAIRIDDRFDLCPSESQNLDPFKELILYLRVSQAFRQRLQMSDRDRALVMAGTCASMLEMTPIADFCRQLVLKNNQGHMLRKYESFGEALEDPDFGVFLKQVRRKLMPEYAEAQLMALDYQCDVRSTDYETQFEFASAVMGVDAEWVKDHFG